MERHDPVTVTHILLHNMLSSFIDGIATKIKSLKKHKPAAGKVHAIINALEFAFSGHVHYQNLAPRSLFVTLYTWNEKCIFYSRSPYCYIPSISFRRPARPRVAGWCA